jgi:hypothetical protein
MLDTQAQGFLDHSLRKGNAFVVESDLAEKYHHLNFLVPSHHNTHTYVGSPPLFHLRIVYNQQKNPHSHMGCCIWRAVKVVDKTLAVLP